MLETRVALIVCLYVKCWCVSVGVLVVGIGFRILRGGFSRGWFYEGGPLAFDKVGWVLAILVC